MNTAGTDLPATAPGAPPAKALQALRLGGAIVLATLAACSSHRLAGERPALLIDPDPASRAELLQVVNGALGKPPVTLPLDALVTSDVLLVEHAPKPTETFHLLIDDGGCALVRDSKGRHIRLPAARCTALHP